MNRAQRAKLQILAANCGIDVRGLSLGQVRHAHNVKRDVRFTDQHDARLDEFLSTLEGEVRFAMRVRHARWRK